MTREIILVEVVRDSDLSTDWVKAFTDLVKAENYFRTLIAKFEITDDEEEISYFLDCGFCDFDYLDEKMSILIHTIPFEEG